MSSAQNRMEPIAIVGMSGRFPGAGSTGAFWQNLRDGVEGIRFFTEEELLAAGYERGLVRDPRFVPARGVIDDAELFDASFFGLSPREAEVMDPQHRVFLEAAWSALEDAGYAPADIARDVGVYAGASMNSYLIASILQNPAAIVAAGSYQAMLANDKDFIATRVAYKLNLRGPAVTVQTACSTSLVAVQMACRALESGECTMALAGGVSINAPRVGGYVYEPGMILSPDGHCRAFDARAKGTVAGEGVGIVVLKRLRDALADGDAIRAVIRGAAINNDGAGKVGYTAPSVDGQAAAIRAAHALAGVDPATITYVEAHGTGTELGDPIEIAALTDAFGETGRKGYCAIGSVKTNIGHLDAAAGVAGLIKAVLALEHRTIPPSLHFTEPNPAIDFDATPFRVNAVRTEWTVPAGTPRRAGVSSFGIGGTNAHVVLEEAPPIELEPSPRPVQLLTVSARTPTALEHAAMALASDLRANPDRSLADVAATLHTGRASLPERRTVVAASTLDAAAALEAGAASSSAASGAGRDRPVAFMFSGQGAQYVGMGRELYESEPTFRAELDACTAVLEPHLGFDLRPVLYPAPGEEQAAADRLAKTAVTQPALFAVEYALARMLMSWGIRPAAMIGHSIGEYVAACLAGVITRDDALRLVAARGRLMDVPGGGMLAVPLAEAAVRERLPAELSIAAINGPAMCAVSGPLAAIDSFAASLEADGITAQALHVAAAFHSAMMDPILSRFEAEAAGIAFSPPSIPFISNVTGTWADAAVCGAPYWARHLRGTVRFWDGIRTLAGEDVILLEVGPGRTLASLARPAVAADAAVPILTTLRHPREDRSDSALLHETLGRLWLAGAAIDWSGYHAGERRRRLPLPTYPFEGRRYWIPDGSSAVRLGNSADREPPRQPDPADWFFVPGWRRSAPSMADAPTDGTWLLFADECGVADAAATELRARGASVSIARSGAGFDRLSDDEYTIDPASPADYRALVAAVREPGSPVRVLHCWSIADAAPAPACIDRDRGFYSLLHLLQALAVGRGSEVRIAAVANGLNDVTGETPFRPERVAALGPVLVSMAEHEHIDTRLVDVLVPTGGDGRERLARDLIAELGRPAEMLVAYRSGYRWTQTWEPVRLPAVTPDGSVLREGGTYLITGGLGGIGMTFARHLAERYRARLVLTARTPLPPAAEWDRLLDAVDAPAATLERIRTVRALEQAGATVLVAAADVADAQAMRGVFETARERFGRIDGVVHAAGLGNGGIIATKTREAAEEVFAAKMGGTEVLHALLAESPADFLLLCSSISAIIPTPGQVAYTAANAFLDGFARANRDARTPVISVNWDVWSDTGMAVDISGLGALRERQERHLEHGILAAEGADLFERILASGLRDVVVSTRELNAAIAFTRGIRIDESAGAGAAAAGTADRGVADAAGDTALAVFGAEAVIAEIWRELLGLETVGPDEDFFEVGGHSLLATQVASRIYRRLGVDVPLAALFEDRTVRSLAARIEAMAGEQDPEREEIEL